MSSYIRQNLLLIAVILIFMLVISIIINANYSDKLSSFCVALNTKTSAVNYEKPQETKKDIIVLIWMWPFGSKFELTCAPFDITGCLLTDDKAMYSKADAVIFHHGDIRSDLQGMPEEPRPHFQKWVWLNMESPTNSKIIPEINNLFNLTCSHRHDSDIFIPYGNLVPISKEDGLFTRTPLKERLVCWIVSNHNPLYRRVGYYNELKNYINIDTYGRAFGRQINNDQYVEIVKSCKFYLSFENSIHKDYITEKFFQPLELGTVPVVLGPPRDDYEIHAPANSFIHVDDFPSPKELAEKLKYLDQHPDEYMGYFEWRDHFKSFLPRLGSEHPCRTCHYLKMRQRFQHIRNLNKWYWGK